MQSLSIVYPKRRIRDDVGTRDASIIVESLRRGDCSATMCKRSVSNESFHSDAVAWFRYTMRKLRLTQIQRDILWIVEEAGEENLSCIRATLGHPEEVEFGRQVDGLERTGLVTRSVEPSSELPSLVLTTEGRAILSDGSLKLPPMSGALVR